MPKLSAAERRRQRRARELAALEYENKAADTARGAKASVARASPLRRRTAAGSASRRRGKENEGELAAAEPHNEGADEGDDITGRVVDVISSWESEVAPSTQEVLGALSTRWNIRLREETLERVLADTSKFSPAAETRPSPARRRARRGTTTTSVKRWALREVTAENSHVESVGGDSGANGARAPARAAVPATSQHTESPLPGYEDSPLPGCEDTPESQPESEMQTTPFVAGDTVEVFEEGASQSDHHDAEEKKSEGEGEPALENLPVTCTPSEDLQHAKSQEISREALSPLVSANGASSGRKPDPSSPPSAPAPALTGFSFASGRKMPASSPASVARAAALLGDELVVAPSRAGHVPTREKNGGPVHLNRNESVSAQSVGSPSQKVGTPGIMPALLAERPEVSASLEGQDFPSFAFASGRKMVAATDKARARAKALLNDVKTNTSRSVETEMRGQETVELTSDEPSQVASWPIASSDSPMPSFSFASGRAMGAASAGAREKAAALLGDSVASGAAPEVASGTTASSDAPMPSFSFASGRAMGAASAGAREKAAALLDVSSEVSGGNLNKQTAAPAISDMSGFSSASGRTLNLASKEARDRAAVLLGDSNSDGNTIIADARGTSTTFSAKFAEEGETTNRADPVSFWRSSASKRPRVQETPRRSSTGGLVSQSELDEMFAPPEKSRRTSLFQYPRSAKSVKATISHTASGMATSHLVTPNFVRDNNHGSVSTPDGLIPLIPAVSDQSLAGVDVSFAHPDGLPNRPSFSPVEVCERLLAMRSVALASTRCVLEEENIQRLVSLDSEQCAEFEFCVDAGNPWVRLYGPSNRVGPDEMRKVLVQVLHARPQTRFPVEQIRKYASVRWVENHYRWVVWKLASLQRSFPSTYGVLLTDAISGLRAIFSPCSVLQQLLSRFDREFDRSPAQRSCLKKLTEQDDSALMKVVILVVASCRVRTVHIPPPAESPATEGIFETVCDVEVTDGWYGIPAALDRDLTEVFARGKVQAGTKIMVYGAQLVGCDQPSDPLDIPAGAKLNLCRNGVRPAATGAKLGFQYGIPGTGGSLLPLRSFSVGLDNLTQGGGVVPRVCVCIDRVYPILYKETMGDNSTIFRTARAEDQLSARHADMRMHASELLRKRLTEEVDEELREEHEEAYQEFQTSKSDHGRAALARFERKMANNAFVRKKTKVPLAPQANQVVIDDDLLEDGMLLYSLFVIEPEFKSFTVFDSTHLHEIQIGNHLPRR